MEKVISDVTVRTLVVGYDNFDEASKAKEEYEDVGWVGVFSTTFTAYWGAITLVFTRYEI